MFAALGVTLLVAGAIAEIAVDRSADGVDLMAIGWILMAGGGLALLVAMIQAADSATEHGASALPGQSLSTNGRQVLEGPRRGLMRPIRRSS